MHFNKHSELQDKHAFLSPSSYHWLNYSPDKLEARWWTIQSARKGTALHKFAEDAIRLKIRLEADGTALSTYVNDCIEWGMEPEVALYYSDNAFGHTDAIRYDPAPSDLDYALLRISDYKSGITPTSEKQLKVYAALFFLEYGFIPFETRIELRIYQREEVRLYEPEPEEILAIMDTIIAHDHHIDMLKEENA